MKLLKPAVFDDDYLVVKCDMAWCLVPHPFERWCLLHHSLFGRSGCDRYLCLAENIEARRSRLRLMTSSLMRDICRPLRCRLNTDAEGEVWSVVD